MTAMLDPPFLACDRFGAVPHMVGYSSVAGATIGHNCDRNNAVSQWETQLGGQYLRHHREKKNPVSRSRGG